MEFETVAVLSPGDMGHAVAAVLRERGYRVVSALADRSGATRARAERVGIQDVRDLDGVAAEADLVLSIMPPAAAPDFADGCASAFERAKRAPCFADCNAIAPETAAAIAKRIEGAGAAFVDGGIIGGPPRAGRPATRLYVSGLHAESLCALGGSTERGDLDVRAIGEEIGRASGLKMVYAGLTKGTSTLQAAVLIAAERMGISAELRRELEGSQSDALARMGIIPFLPADAGRWIGEMQEIARAFRSAGVPSGFHEAAEEIYKIMDQTPFAQETRETLDRSRTLEQAIRVFARILD